jgi:thiol-disulfide isomerase/thioredoxin
MDRNSTRMLAVVAVAGIAAAFGGCKTAADVKSAAQSSSAASSRFQDEPDVTFQLLNGSNLPLASLKGKVVLVNFWATWCDPCREEIPWLISFQQEYASRGFTLVGVAMDDAGQKVVAPFVQNTEFNVDGTKSTMNYPIVLGNEDIAEKFGGLFGYPSSFLISRDGKIVKRIIGLVSKEELAREIELQLAVPAPASSAPATASVR